MRKIKRYPNRKLYDTVSRKYVTLQAIAELVRQGEAVQVVDTQSGKDVTQPTLSKIVLDNKAGDQVISSSLLTDIIQKSRDSLSGFFRRSLDAGRGITSWVEDEVERSVKGLVKMGKLRLNEADALKKELSTRIKKKVSESEASIEERISSAVEMALHAFRLPTQKDLSTLREKIDELTERIDSLTGNGHALTARPATRARKAKVTVETKKAAPKAKKARAARVSSVPVKSVPRSAEPVESSEAPPVLQS